MANILPFAVLGWYNWIYWWSVNATYPEPKEVLGRWLGLSLDTGPAMTAKVLKSNGQVVPLSTYRALSKQELKDEANIRHCGKFDKGIEARLGSPITADDLKSLGKVVPMPGYN